MSSHSSASIKKQGAERGAGQIDCLIDWLVDWLIEMAIRSFRVKGGSGHLAHINGPLERTVFTTHQQLRKHMKKVKKRLSCRSNLLPSMQSVCLPITYQTYTTINKFIYIKKSAGRELLSCPSIHSPSIKIVDSLSFSLECSWEC